MILRTVLRMISEVALWTAAVGVVALAVSSAAAVAARLRPSRLGFGWALAGALLVAGLQGRLGAPEPTALAIGRRDLPLLWMAAGAAAGTIVWLARRRAR